FDDAGLDPVQRRLQLRIDEGFLRVLLERRGREMLGESHHLSPIAGVTMPASTSATCRAFTGLPRRCSLPAMFIRQPRSPASSVSAPVAAMCSAFLVTMVFEMSGYFTQKVPPKPQHTSASCISLSASPSTLASSRRGCALTPSSRRPEQLS